MQKRPLGAELRTACQGSLSETYAILAHLNEDAGCIICCGRCLVSTTCPVYLIGASEHSDCKVLAVLLVICSQVDGGLVFLQLS